MNRTQLGRNLRVAVIGHGGGQNQLLDPVVGFPFSWWDGVKYEPELSKADVIMPYFGERPYTKEIDVYASNIEATRSDDERAKMVWYTLCDFPSFATRIKPGLKFVLSPGPDRKLNDECNVYPVPIHCCPGDYTIQFDTEWTNIARNQRKTSNFAFIGNVTGSIPGKFFGGRTWLARLAKRLPKFLLTDAAGSAFLPNWSGQHRAWMLAIGSARYGFAPAGPSNGPRGYWTMQCGTVPIFSDVKQLPFEDKIDWKKIAVFVDQANRETFDYASLPMDGPEYDAKRQGCIEAWDKYCRMDACAREMARIMCRYFGEDPVWVL
jgi:hypothetical protein